MKIMTSYTRGSIVFSLVLLTIFLILFFQKAIALSPPDSARVAQSITSIEKRIVALDSTTKELQNARKESKMRSLWVSVIIIAMIAIAIEGFMLLAIYSRKDIIQNTNDKSEVVEFLMKQTLGLPQGTIRGVLALTTGLVFVGSVFYFDEIPEAVKIITASVFGYYFGKQTNQTRELMEAMTGKTKQRTLQKQEATAALAEARAEGATSHARNKLDEAQKLIDEGDQKQNESEAIACYRRAKEIAFEAKQDAINAKRQEAQD